eukprot:5112022-Prymnesium_polylepis.1
MVMVGGGDGGGGGGAWGRGFGRPSPALRMGRERRVESRARGTRNCWSRVSAAKRDSLVGLSSA